MTPTYVNPTPNLFPSANTVYVDNDYKKLRSKGLLAYRTLEEGVISWRAGGKARARYGTPSATNPALISVGAGTIETLSVTTECLVDVDFLSVVGRGRETTILTSSAGTIDTILRFNTTNYLLKDLTVLGPSNANRVLTQSTAANWVGTWDNIRVTGNPVLQLSIISAGFDGKIIDCIFDGSSISTAIGGLEISTATITGRIVDCIFLGSSSQTTLITLSADFQGKIIGCEFRGNVATALFTSTSTFGGFGEISDCYFECERSGTIGMLCNSVSGAGFIISNSTILTEGKCMSIVGGDRLRISSCYLFVLTGNFDAIELLSGTTNIGLYGTRVGGTGSGLAINSVSAVNATIVGSFLRMPTGNVPGSSISSNVTNIVNSPFNAEIPASVTY